jgi:hypothetical protein
MTSRHRSANLPLVLLSLASVAACDSPQPAAPEVPGPAPTAIVGAGSIASSLASASAPSDRIAAQALNVGAAPICPPQRFANNLNLAANPGFEIGPPLGVVVSFPPGPVPTPSAAPGWFMHTDNINSRVSTRHIPTTVPGPGGARMLHMTAASFEGGVYQIIRNSPRRVMFSVWVKVLAGQAVIGANAMLGQTPNAFSTKIGEWEQLRVCTDGAWPTDMFYVYNSAAAGGQFYIDRVEIRQIS